MDVVARFEELLASPAPPLDQALSLIAANGRPQVDPGSVVGALDDLASTCDASEPDALAAWLFGGGRFVGNTEDYYEADNSLLDRVLERRTGIPITLAVVAIEVGRRRGIELLGVGMPGHFLIRDADSSDHFYDPFSGGRSLDRLGCQRLFEELHGSGLAFDGQHLRATSNSMIVMRVLNNLHGALVRTRDRTALADVLQLQAALPGAGVAARTRLAGVLSADGRFAEAAVVHDRLAIDDVENASEHEWASTRLRARLN